MEPLLPYRVLFHSLSNLRKRNKISNLVLFLLKNFILFCYYDFIQRKENSSHSNYVLIMGYYENHFHFFPLRSDFSFAFFLNRIVKLDCNQSQKSKILIDGKTERLNSC